MIQRTDYSIDYTIPSGGTVQLSFTFEFPIKEPSQILCFDITPAGSEDEADIITPIAAGYYRVSAAPGGYGEGGSVNLTVPLAAGHILRIARKTPATQEKRFSNQERFRPEEFEDALDRLVMLIQEIGAEEIRRFIQQLERDLAEEESARENGDAALGTAIQTEANTRAAADAALGQRVSQEAAARVACDNTLTQWIEEERAGRVSTDTTLQSQITSLGNTKADAVALANADLESIARDDALLARIIANIAAIAQIDTGKMPVAPNDGNMHVASGNSWFQLRLEIGDPFVTDADGYAVIVERPAYLPNKVWDIRPDYMVLSEASQPGDMDSMFVIDADGYAVLAE